MGLIRKTMSVSTLGVVNYRNQDERQTKYAKSIRRHARAQTALAVKANEIAERQVDALDYVAAAHVPQPTFQAGWFIDEHDPRFIRWWDTTGPSEHVQPIPVEPPTQLTPPGPATVQPALAGAAGTSTGLGEELARLAALHSQGALTDDEFVAAKARLLGGHQ